MGQRGGVSKWAFAAVMALVATCAGSQGVGRAFAGNPFMFSAPVINADSAQPWATSPGFSPASAYDQASFTWPSAPPQGTVTFTLFADSNCVLNQINSDTETLSFTGTDSNGTQPSSTYSNLVPGAYGFLAVYSGDMTDMYPPETVCTPFTVAQTQPSISFSSFSIGNDTTGSAPTPTAVLNVNLTDGNNETITFNYFSGSCGSGNLFLANLITFQSYSAGNPIQDATGYPLPAGSYCIEAIFSGDADYASVSTNSETPNQDITFTVTPGTSSVTSPTVVAQAPNDFPGSTATDTATVTVSSSIAPMGNVTFTLFSDDSCGMSGGKSLQTSVVTVSSQSPYTATSAPSPALAPAGTYSYAAVYNANNSDPNYGQSNPVCQTFTVNAATPSGNPVVFNANLGMTWPQPPSGYPTGTPAYEQFSVGGVNGVGPTGSVTFTFFDGGSCGGSAVWVDSNVTLNGGTAQSASTASLAAGTYSFLAQYSGDQNYTAINNCVQFAVLTGNGQLVTQVYVEGGSAWPAPPNGDPLGTAAFDTSSVLGNGGITPTGTVTFQYFTNSTCSGSGLFAMPDVVTMDSNGNAQSVSTPNLGAGDYWFQAVYSGDGNYQGNSQCEEYIVNQDPSATVFGTLNVGTDQTGAVASDNTVTVSGNPAVNGFTPSGSVTYTLYNGGGCNGTLASQYAQTTKPLINGNVAGTGSTNPLPKGTYSFGAAYSGDGNFVASGACLVFAISAAGTTTTSTFYDDTSGTLQTWNGSEVTGAVAVDAATVSNTGIVPSGSVVYHFYTAPTGTTVTCAAGQEVVNAAWPQTVTLSGGSVPNSQNTAPLAAAQYGFKAVYSGDGNYGGSNGGCETFDVVAAGQSVNSVVWENTPTNRPWAGTESSGATAFDTSTITKKGNSTPTGQVTYSFFTNGNCTPPANTTLFTTQTVTVTAGGAVPNSNPTTALLPGTYSFQASYAGDANYTAATSCKQFNVQNNPIIISPPSWTLAPLGIKTFTVSGGTGIGYTWAITSNNSGGSIVGAGNQAGYQAGGIGTVTDVITVKDSLGETGTVNVTVTTALTLLPNTPTTPPQGSIGFVAGGGQAPYTFKLQTNGSGGTINSSTGAYVAGPTGSTTDYVYVSDANGAFVQTPVTVTAGVSIAPANPSVAPGGTVAFSAMGGSDTGFVWSITANKSGGMINSSTGAYMAGSKGMVSDTVKVVDSLGNTASVSVSVGGGVTISPFNPSLAPKGTQTFTAMGGSGSGYTWKLTTNASGGSVNSSTGAYTAGATGSRTDVLQVTDSLGNTATTNITVTGGVAISPATASVAPLGTVKFSASGGSGSGFTYSLATNASGGSVNASTGAYKAGTTGGVTDVVEVTDSLGNTAEANVTVTAALAIAPASASAAPRGSVTFTASGGSGTYVFALQTNASGGSINAMTGAYAAGTTANVIDVLGVADSNGATATAKVTVGPGVTISPVSPSVAPGGTVQFSAMGGSGTGFTWSLTTNQSGGGITAGGAYTAGMTGKTVDTVKVVDSLGNSATTQVSVGGGLAINPATATTPPLGTVTFSAVGGAGGYTFKISTNASGGTINANIGAYTAGTKGNVTDVVTVSDSAGVTATANVNVGPGVTVTPATVMVSSGAMVPFAVSGGSGTGYTWSINPNNSGGSINAMTGVYVAGMTGGVTDTVVVRDSLGNTASAVVTVKMNVVMGDGGVMDSGMPEDSGTMMKDSGMPMKDASSGMDSSMPGMDAASTEDSGNSDSGFEVDGSGEGGVSPGQSNSSGNCGCTVVGVDTSGIGSLAGLALGLALALRRRRRH